MRQPVTGELEVDRNGSPVGHFSSKAKVLFFFSRGVNKSQTIIYSTKKSCAHSWHTIVSIKI
jgi:hypothetical protein